MSWGHLANLLMAAQIWAARPFGLGIELSVPLLTLTVSAPDCRSSALAAIAEAGRTYRQTVTEICNLARRFPRVRRQGNAGVETTEHHPSHRRSWIGQATQFGGVGPERASSSSFDAGFLHPSPDTIALRLPIVNHMRIHGIWAANHPNRLPARASATVCARQRGR